MSLSTSFNRGDAEARRVNTITETVIRCAIEVHRVFGPGLLESAYEEYVTHEVIQQKLRVKRQSFASRLQGNQA